MAQAFVLLLIFSHCLCIGRAFGCSLLTPTNISCANYKRKEYPLRAYCAGTRKDNAFWASSEQPFAKALPSEYNDDVIFFQNTFAQVTELVVKKRRDKRYREKCLNAYARIEDGSSDRYWYEVQRKWRFGAIAHEKRIGLQAPKSQCFTQIEFDTPKSRSVMRRMSDLNEAFLVIGKKVAEAARKRGSLTSFFERQIACWKGVVSTMSAPWKTNALQCMVRRAAGYRRPGSGKFNLGMTVTNAPIDEPRPEKQRHYLSETWTYDEASDTVRAVPLPSFVRGDLNGLRNETTTALFTWGGTVKMSFFINIPPQQGPAMRRINEATSHLQDIIHDDITPSNVAILIFPALLALVPVSSFELPSFEDKLNRFVFYSAVTDVVATLPLFIKGVELLVLANKQHTRCTAWAVGVEGDGVAVIEMWCADCVHPSFFQKYGAVFIVIAFLFTVLGIVLEILAFLWVRQKRWHKQRFASKWWERAGVTGDLCTEYECCSSRFVGTTPTRAAIVNSRNAYFSSRRNLGRYS